MAFALLPQPLRSIAPASPLTRVLTWWRKLQYLSKWRRLAVNRPMFMLSSKMLGILCSTAVYNYRLKGTQRPCFVRLSWQVNARLQNTGSWTNTWFHLMVNYEAWWRIDYFIINIFVQKYWVLYVLNTNLFCKTLLADQHCLISSSSRSEPDDITMKQKPITSCYQVTALLFSYVLNVQLTQCFMPLQG